MRPSGRKNNELREISIETDVSIHAAGSCLISIGNTKVLCTASIDEEVPRWMKGSKKGWVTAEYGMLPGSTNTRIRREATQGKQGGRTQEIQRLIGRSLRAAVDLHALGERQIIVDCDVLQADGGTRTASITGGYVALHLAFDRLCREKQLSKIPFLDEMAAVSCGVYKGEAILDLDYEEDSNAGADSNFVMTGSGKIIEVQGTAEDGPFDEEQFLEMMKLAKAGIARLIEAQRKALKL